MCLGIVLQCRIDLVDHALRLSELMLPYSHDGPPFLPEHSPHDSIASAVCKEFGLPELCVVDRSRPTSRARMPEAAVYKYSQPHSRKSEVGSTRQRKMATPA